MNNFEEYYKIRKISEDLFSLIVRIKKLNNFEVETLVNLLEFTIKKIGGLKMNKYEMLYDDKIEIGSHTLYRIRALKKFWNCKSWGHWWIYRKKKKIYLKKEIAGFMTTQKFVATQGFMATLLSTKTLVSMAMLMYLATLISVITLK